jgi:hypothetical protein
MGGLNICTHSARVREFSLSPAYSTPARAHTRPTRLTLLMFNRGFDRGACIPAHRRRPPPPPPCSNCGARGRCRSPTAAGVSRARPSSPPTGGAAGTAPRCKSAPNAPRQKRVSRVVGRTSHTLEGGLPSLSHSASPLTCQCYGTSSLSLSSRCVRSGGCHAASCAACASPRRSL